MTILNFLLIRGFGFVFNFDSSRIPELLLKKLNILAWIKNSGLRLGTDNCWSLRRCFQSQGDCAWLEGFIYKQVQAKFRLHVIRNFASYLPDRKLRVKLEDFLSSWRPLTSEVPQGIQLSSLFAIYPNDLPRRDDTIICQYADDTAILGKFRSLTLAIRRLDDFFRALEKWCTRWPKPKKPYISRDVSTPTDLCRTCLNIKHQASTTKSTSTAHTTTDVLTYPSNVWVYVRTASSQQFAVFQNKCLCSPGTKTSELL